MKSLFLHAAIAAALACPAAACLAQGDKQADKQVEKSSADKLPPPATTLYRQVMPDGRVVYSDEPLKGAKIDQTIKVEPPIKGNAWAAESGSRPVAKPRSEPTPVRKVNTPPGQKKTFEQASADVVRAEMKLEDAKKRQQEGVEPLEGERTGNVNGTSRLNESYQVRQKWLAREVAQAEANLKQAIKARDAAGSAL
jgi:hypothetical protein